MKIVNAGTCDVKIVNAMTCGVNVDSQEKRRGDPAGGTTWRHGEEGGTNALGMSAEAKVGGRLTVIKPKERRSELVVAGTCDGKVDNLRAGALRSGSDVKVRSKVD